MPKATPYFTAASLQFLRELAANNSREWFTAHKPDYEQHVKLPFLRLIGDLDAPLKAISAQYVANPKPVGGSMFRIHRDTRFAADKTPYKPWAGASFYHQATRAVTRGGDARYLLSVDAILSVEPGTKVKAGDVIARLPTASAKSGDGAWSRARRGPAAPSELAPDVRPARSPRPGAGTVGPAPSWRRARPR